MVITTVQQVKLLGVIIDSKLKLDDHVKSLCLKANRNAAKCHKFMFSRILCCLFLSFVWYSALSSCIVICCKPIM